MNYVEWVLGKLMRPPVKGSNTPVVPGKLIGNLRMERIAKKAKACASMASPFQPIASDPDTVPGTSRVKHFMR